MYFDYASANATTSSKHPTPTATLGSSYTVPLSLHFLYSSDESAALKVAERCHRLIKKLKVPHEKSSVSQFVTASIGVGTINPSAEMGPKNFIEAVDKLLYAAKQTGRNRTESGRL